MESGDDFQVKRWKDFFTAMLYSVQCDYAKPFSIAIVPEELGKWNKDACMPKVVSIGPRYKGAKRDLLQMEEIKWRCMLSLLNRTEDPVQSLDMCQNAILHLDADVRTSYVDQIKLNWHELATIMLVDGCFLLELLITASEDLDAKLESPYISPAAEVKKSEELISDLTIIDNQIPIVIIRRLSRLLFTHVFKDEEIIKNLARSLLGYSHDSSSITDRNANHILELVHSSIQGDSEKEEEENHDDIKCSSVVVRIIDIEGVQVQVLNRCATMLQAAGVKI